MVPWIRFLPIAPGDFPALTLVVEDESCQGVDIDCKVLSDPDYR